MGRSILLCRDEAIKNAIGSVLGMRNHREVSLIYAALWVFELAFISMFHAAPDIEMSVVTN